MLLRMQQEKESRDLSSEKDEEEDIENLNIFVEDESRPLEPRGKHEPIIVRKEGEAYRMVNLYPWQVEHATLCATRLQTLKGVIDTSEPGAGKTSLAIWLAQHYRMAIFVLCPAKLRQNWKEATAEYSVDYLGSASYELLRSKRDDNPYLSYDPDTNEYTATQATMDLLYDRSVLVCVDEVQHAKNNTAQAASLASFLECINYPSVYGQKECPSRWLLMSGTPFDKTKHAAQFLRLAGYAPNTSEHTHESLAQTLEICREVDPGIAYEKITKGNLWDLYKTIVKPRLTSSMPKPRSGFKKYSFNTFFDTHDPKVKRRVDEAVEALRRATEKKEKKKGRLGDIVRAMVALHAAKVEIYHEPVRRLLSRTTTDKVIFLTEYDGSTARIGALLEDYAPVVITGRTPMRKRQELVREFNTEPGKRLLIAKLEVIGEGFDLHDRVGDSRRHIFILPNYKIINIVQGLNRVDRVGRKSDIGVYIAYVEGVAGALESSILEKVYEKCAVIRSTLGDVSRAQIRLPSSFPRYYESQNRAAAGDGSQAYPFDWATEAAE